MKDFRQDFIDVTNIRKEKELYMEVVESLESRSKKVEELPIGFLPTVSSQINGLSRGELVVVGARPSNGKSIFCIQLGLSLALKGKKVHFCSLEMSNTTCGERIVANLAKVNTLDIQNGRAFNILNQPNNKITQGYNKIVDTNLTFSDTIGFKWDEICFIIENMKDLDVLIIDYIQMIHEQDQLKKEAIDNYIKKLRFYAIKKNICIVIASQINRAGANTKMPQMHELKSTGCLEEVADKVFLLHYDYFYTKNKDDQYRFEVLLEKNRQGRTFIKECKIIPEFCLITEEVSSVY